MTAYQNSEAQKCTLYGTNGLDQLTNRRRATVGAIEYWQAQGNAGEVQFFQEQLELIDKRIESEFA